jgi:hypothetical protein
MSSVLLRATILSDEIHFICYHLFFQSPYKKSPKINPIAPITALARNLSPPDFAVAEAVAAEVLVAALVRTVDVDTAVAEVLVATFVCRADVDEEVADVVTAAVVCKDDVDATEIAVLKLLSVAVAVAVAVPDSSAGYVYSPVSILP